MTKWRYNIALLGAENNAWFGSLRDTGGTELYRTWASRSKLFPVQVCWICVEQELLLLHEGGICVRRAWADVPLGWPNVAPAHLSTYLSTYRPIDLPASLPPCLPYPGSARSLYPRDACMLLVHKGKVET